MDNSLLKGLWKYTLPIPSFLWKKEIFKMAKKAAVTARFMTEDHHRIRNFVVKTLPETDQPISLETIVEKLKIPHDRVLEMVDELEKQKFFLFRNEDGDIAWAYPVTVDKTPHRAFFSTGEQINSA